jgi:hypothetical protein
VREAVAGVINQKDIKELPRDIKELPRDIKELPRDIKNKIK